MELEEPTNEVQIDTLRLAGGVGGLVGAALFAYLGVTAYGMGAIGFGFGFICLLGAGYALIALGKAPCPDCGFVKSGTALKNSESIHCAGCDGYFSIRDGKTVMTGADAVEDHPVFATACPQSIKWPSGCCVCGSEVTGLAKVRLELEESSPLAQDMLARAATLGTFKLVSKRVFEVEVPVCGAHGTDPAELRYRYDEEQLHILFRSRAYMSAFAEENGPVFWGA